MRRQFFQSERHVEVALHKLQRGPHPVFGGLPLPPRGSLVKFRFAEQAHQFAGHGQESGIGIVVIQASKHVFERFADQAGVGDKE